MGDLNERIGVHVSFAALLLKKYRTWSQISPDMKPLHSKELNDLCTVVADDSISSSISEACLMYLLPEFITRGDKLLSFSAFEATGSNPRDNIFETCPEWVMCSGVTSMSGVQPSNNLVLVADGVICIIQSRDKPIHLYAAKEKSGLLGRILSVAVQLAGDPKKKSDVVNFNLNEFWGGNVLSESGIRDPVEI
jgi:hypothetical protein